MKFLGNIIWLICGGLLTAVEYLISSLLLMITIIGIPFGLQTLKLGMLALWPFGIRVTDNGPGIPSDLIEDIFVPFFTTKATGSGIGLSLSRQIIRMHGGELSVASQPYRETCFTVSLPVKP